ncbi:hypothetical protein EYF80_048058 [Liparis tanakae]|uniref:Uncharacterized protein n=1 Tax=Liparis tanakae TaxID=230148 RepID=A0A4Z2FKL1_9TELE|nr:hypothetical protein EYF80_048058 [Liparis tanakae]
MKVKRRTSGTGDGDEEREVQPRDDDELLSLRASEPQSLRDSETQSLRDSEPQSLRDSETQRLRASETQRLRASETQRLRASETQKLRDSEPQSLRDSEPQRLGPRRAESLPRVFLPVSSWSSVGLGASALVLLQFHLPNESSDAWSSPLFTSGALCRPIKVTNGHQEKARRTKGRRTFFWGAGLK